MIASILHPGEMGISVAAAAVQSGHSVLWVSDGRSDKTKKRAESLKLKDVEKLSELAESDVIFSICPPQVAIETATSVSATNFKGLYVDANAGSPETKKLISEILNKNNIDFVDAGIVGPPANFEGSTRMYVSGERSEEVEDFFSNGLLDVRSIGSEIGKAASLKIAYGAWTKGSSALILAVRAMAKSSGVEKELIEEWKLSQPSAESLTLLSASLNSPKAWRFVSEMQEISKTFEAENIPSAFWEAAAEIYARLSKFKDFSEDQLDIDTVLEKLIE